MVTSPPDAPGQLPSLAARLVDAGALTLDLAREIARRAAAADRSFLSEILATGPWNEQSLLDYLSRLYCVPQIDLSDISLEALPRTYRHFASAVEPLALPLGVRGLRFSVAVADPSNDSLFQSLSLQTGLLVDVVLAEPSKLKVLAGTFLNSGVAKESRPTKKPERTDAALSEFYVSEGPMAERPIVITPLVFSIPTDTTIDRRLVSVMMPFRAEFQPVYSAIQSACEFLKLNCIRADEIWDEATISQEIFNLIVRSRVVVADLTGRNANVMYEMGIAHTLGKHVVPIAQSMDHVPFDIIHHRVLKYLPNQQGLRDLSSALSTRLSRVAT